MAKVIVAPEVYEIEKGETDIFLGGGITSCPDWQKDLIKLLQDVENLVIYNPRRENFPIEDKNAALEQITWEYEYLKKADILSFWFSSGSLNPIVLYELGMWANSRKTPTIVGIDPKYERTSDVEIQTNLARPEIEIVASLEDLANEIKKVVQSIIYQASCLPESKDKSF